MRTATGKAKLSDRAKKLLADPTSKRQFVDSVLKAATGERQEIHLENYKVTVSTSRITRKAR